MTIGNQPTTAALAAQTAQPANNVQQQASIDMLKKVMQDQSDMAEKLLSSGSPKGQLIDIRA